MTPEDTLRRAIDLMESALELLDSVNASDAGALLDHAIHAARECGDIVGERRSSLIGAVLRRDMASFGEPGTLRSARLIEGPDHPIEADRA